jgi:undecaprenyl-diphosphatase
MIAATITSGQPAVGFVTSFIVALISIKWLIGYVQTRTFIPFGIYRILVAVVLGFVLYGSLLRI